MPDLLMEVALDVLMNANCADHKTDLGADEVAEALAAARWCDCWDRKPSSGPPETCGSYCDTYGLALFKLKDGRYAVVQESADSSGHG